jgi:hypothetical protein
MEVAFQPDVNQERGVEHEEWNKFSSSSPLQNGDVLYGQPLMAFYSEMHLKYLQKIAPRF